MYYHVMFLVTNLKAAATGALLKCDLKRCSLKICIINFKIQKKYGSSHRRCFFKKCVLRPAKLFEKSVCHRCFPVKFAKFLRTPFLQNTSGRLLLIIAYYCFQCGSLKWSWFSHCFSSITFCTHLWEKCQAR